MKKYEEIREELRKILGVIIEEEYEAIMKSAKMGLVTLKDNVSKEDLHEMLGKKLDHPPGEEKSV